MKERPRARTLQGTRAGIVSRVVAGAIDIGIAFAVLWAAVVLVAAAGYLLFDNPFDVPKPGAFRGGFALFALLVVMFTIAWSGSGRTIGDVVVGLRVVTERGDVVGWKRALVRAVVLVVLIIPATLWILVSRKNAGLHDLACRTAVVYDWRAHRDPVVDPRRDSRPIA